MDQILSLSFLEEEISKLEASEEPSAIERVLFMPMPIATIIKYSVIVAAVFQILSFVFNQVSIVFKGKEFSQEFTDAIRRITGDNKVKVYMFATGEPNVFYHGGKSLYITKELVNLLTKNESIAYLLHAYGHKMYKHNLSNMLSELIINSGTLAVAFKILNTNPFIYLAIAGGIVFRHICFMFYNLLVKHKQQYEADAVTRKYGYDKHLISAFKKVDRYLRKKLCDQMEKEECEEYLKKIHKWGEYPTIAERIEVLVRNTIVRFVKTFGKALGLKLVAKYLAKLAQVITKYPSMVLKLLSNVGLRNT